MHRSRGYIKRAFNTLPINLQYFLYKNFNKKNYLKMQQKRRYVAKENEGSLKGFDDLKCIYVHIPKAGGVSINRALFGNLGGGHATIRDYLLIFGPQTLNNYYKFTVVRNPWARIYSAYKFLKKGGMNSYDKDWAITELSSYSSFESFVLNWLNKKNIMRMVHFKPQLDFIMINNKIWVDDIFKLEELEDAFIEISNRIEIQNILEHFNKSSETLNEYREFYSNKTKSIVEKLYFREIEFLKYSF